MARAALEVCAQACGLCGEECERLRSTTSTVGYAPRPAAAARAPATGSSLLTNPANIGRVLPPIHDLTLFNSGTINFLLYLYCPLTQEVYTAISNDVHHRNRGRRQKEGLYG